MSISDDMKLVFLESWKIYEIERQFNYQNWGKYPYRDRKNSVQIVADFNANAYSVNGLFVTESSYTQVYPPQIIESIETVLIAAVEAQTIIYDAYIVIANGVDGTPESESIYQQAIIIAGSAERYETVVTREFVDVEAVEIQSMSYLFPFDCAPDSMGRLKLSL